MKRFQFRLERVLKLRAYHEREWELKLAAATGECVALEEQIRSVVREKRESFHALSGSYTTDISYRMSQEAYLTYLERRLESLENTLMQKQEEREKIAEQYRQAMMERKVLDKLKERRSGEYYREQLNHEHKALDEVATTSAALKRTLFEEEA